ncbi:MAG: MTH1187 family thiamine-binding protein [Planctomycetota bacterium]
MIIAQLTVIPLGTATASLSKYVAGFQKELKKLGFKPVLGAMSTTIEAKSMDKILKAVKRLHEMVFENGAFRALTSVTIDERRDKEGSINQKLNSVRKKILK